VRVHLEKTAVPTYKDLIAWQRAMNLVVEIYGLTKTLPDSERFGISSQLQRAAVSIPTNLAEGHSRRTTRSYASHVSIALGSQAEVETLLEVCARLELGEESVRNRVTFCATEVGRLLYGLHRALETREPPN
jgi:four helix bundle protein